jgi:hypothetical protein
MANEWVTQIRMIVFERLTSFDLESSCNALGRQSTKNTGPHAAMRVNKSVYDQLRRFRHEMNVQSPPIGNWRHPGVSINVRSITQSPDAAYWRPELAPIEKISRVCCT